MKILIAGDVHGNIKNVKHLFDIAEQQECDGIVQVGDFGFWTHKKEGVVFLQYVAALISERNIFLWWLDGNHENHQNLQELYDLDEHGFRPMFPRDLWKEDFPVHHPFVHLPRGTIWEWDGVRFCAFGGAYSVDKLWRIQKEGRMAVMHTLWWPEETITEAELINFENSNPEPVDVLLTHDCPAGVDIPTLSNPRNPFHGMKFPESDANRERLSHAANLVQPKLLIHGHYHDRYQSTYVGDGFTTKVIGLDCDNSIKNQHIIFDTKEPGWA